MRIWVQKTLPNEGEIAGSGLVVGDGLVTKSCLTLVTPWTVAPRFLCPWDSPGKDTGEGCHFLLQGIFQTQASGLLQGRQILYWLSCKGSRVLFGMASKKDRVNHLNATDQEQSGALCSGTITCPCPQWAPTLASLDSLLGPKVPLLVRGRVQTQREQNQLESDPQGFYFGALWPDPNPIGWTATEHERSPSSQLAKALAPFVSSPTSHQGDSCLHTLGEEVIHTCSRFSFTSRTTEHSQTA